MTLITNLDTANQAVNTPGHAISIASFLRTDDTTAYGALDVMASQSPGTEAIEFPNTGRSGAILRAMVVIAETDTIFPRLWVFDSEPTNHTDNVALALVASDMPKIVTRFDFVDADKLLVGTGLNVYFASGYTTAGNEVSLKTPYVTDTGSLYGILQTVTGSWTPAASTRITIRLQLERD